MSAPSNMQQVYVSEDLNEPTSVQFEFQDHYDMSNPDEARLSYQRLMHQHTKAQFETATSSAHRRASPSEHSVSSLHKENSDLSMATSS